MIDPGGKEIARTVANSIGLRLRKPPIPRSVGVWRISRGSARFPRLEMRPAVVRNQCFNAIGILARGIPRRDSHRVSSERLIGAEE